MNFKSSWPNRIVLSFVILAFASDALSRGAKAQLPSDQLSRFEAHTTVGIAPLQGAVTFSAATGEYRITGGGANLWGLADAFQPHDANVLEAALSSNVSAQKPTPVEQNQNPSDVRSKISIYDLDSKSIRVVYTADKLWEAPNWSPDGKYLLANSGGGDAQIICYAQASLIRTDVPTRPGLGSTIQTCVRRGSEMKREPAPRYWRRHAGHLKPPLAAPFARDR